MFQVPQYITFLESEAYTEVSFCGVPFSVFSASYPTCRFQPLHPYDDPAGNTNDIFVCHMS